MVKVLKLTSEKIRKRENSWRGQLDSIPHAGGSKPRLWFHAASMGEFEQAKAIIEIIKQETNFEIAVSFFSPSGYENQLKYKHADFILYLPIDTRKNAKLFLDKVSPDIAIFIRYEYWYNFLCQIENRDIPAVMICATRTGNHLFGKGIGKKIFQKILTKYSRIYTVGKSHTQFFKQMDYQGKLITSADTRFDRIWEKVINRTEIIITKNDLKHELTLVCGSTWQEDEQMIARAYSQISKDINLIIVPHEPTSKNIKSLRSLFPNSQLFSELHAHPSPSIDSPIIVDSIGGLLSLYSLADIVYVGGGFGAGVHSLAEPAGYGVPLSCGVNVKSSPDATILLEENALEIIHNEKELGSWLEKSFSSEYRNTQGNKTSNYVKSRLGWSKKIADDLKEMLEKTKI